MTVEVDEWVGIIADNTAVEFLGGIMGGDRTSVSSDTRNIYIEVAFWCLMPIRGRCQTVQFLDRRVTPFRTRRRFQCDVTALERITALVLEICGVEGETTVGPVDDQILSLPKRDPVVLRREKAEKVIGIPLSTEQIADIFTRLGLSFVQNGEDFTVTPPSYRFDIEIEEDLIEEIARVYGFEKHSSPAAGRIQCHAYQTWKIAWSLFSIRQQMADLDYQEVVNYSFVEEEWEK